MQALTGLFARQFGTPNYAAHGGFCSVNMAAGMIYTIGGSFWEFGGPDLERAKLFVMIGTAEDHHSNPLKIAISKFKRAGGRFISINPVRTGYSAIADEWMPIRPGTDGALLLALMHELIAHRPLRPRVPRALHQRGQLVNIDPATRATACLVATTAPTRRTRCIRRTSCGGTGIRTAPCRATRPAPIPMLFGDFTLPDGTPVQPGVPAARASGCARHTPEWAAESPASRRRRSAASRTRWA